MLPTQSLKSQEIKRLPRLLIGQDNWDLIVTIQTYSIDRKLPALSLTKLGWVVHGRVPSRTTKNHTLMIKNADGEGYKEDSDAALYKLVRTAYNLDGLGITSFNRRNKSEERAEAILKNTAKRVGSNWEVGLLWASDNVEMPNNREQALQRLYSLERKMDNNTEYVVKYCKQIQNLIDSKYCFKNDENESSLRAWYLPHFGSVNINKPDKIRPVFDASAEYRGTSLNANLLSGRDMVSSLLGVLFRFRQRAIAFTGDIREMFLQVKIRDQDQWAQKFLWRGMDREREPETYVMSSMIFGSTSSPCSANYVMNKNATEYETQYPEAVKAI